MKRMLTTVAAAARRRRPSPPSAPRRRATPTGSTGAGSTFVSPLVSLWAADYASKTGTQIAYSPVGSGAGIAAITARQVDFGASRRAADARPVQRVQGLRPDPVGAVGDVDHLQPAEDVPNNLHMTGAGAREHLPRHDHEVERPGDQGAEPEGRACRRPRSRRSTAPTTRARRTTSPTTCRRSARRGSRRSASASTPNWPAGQGGSGSAGVAGHRLEHARARSATSTSPSR